MTRTPKLTIGMAHYDDFTGLWPTLQALRLYHAEAMADCELLVVDNRPDSPHGRLARELIERWAKRDSNIRYIAAPEIVGTAAPRERIFREARGEAVLCLDCHVLVVPGVIGRLIEYYDAHPGTNDLLSGPLLYDDLSNLSTHFEDVWRSEMWGVWGTDPRGLDPEGKPFEIPAMGLGLFSCRKEAWPGFHPGFRGFGGEEFYLHEKVRQRGGRCLCLPFLRWMHRFGRPGGVPYPLSRWHKVRNYVLGHRELGLPLDRVREHFVDSGLMPKAQWKAILTNPENPPPPAAAPPKKRCGACGSGGRMVEAAKPVTLEELYDLAVKTPSEIHEHCPKLRELASECEHVTALGLKPGTPLVALLAGQPGRLVSYDRITDPITRILEAQKGKTEVAFQQGDSCVVEIEETDLLFIDTKHTADQLMAELDRHAGRVRRWIVLHETQRYGEHGEDGGPGLLPALRRFLREQPEWSVVSHAQNNHGLTVLSRDERDKPTLPSKVTMAANFAQAVAKHVADGAAKVDAATLERRLAICSLCEQRRENRCAVCGCYLAEKAAWRTSECPLGKWRATERIAAFA